jgi:hypothetical protein
MRRHLMSYVTGFFLLNVLLIFLTSYNFENAPKHLVNDLQFYFNLFLILLLIFIVAYSVFLLFKEYNSTRKLILFIHILILLLSIYWIIAIIVSNQCIDCNLGQKSIFLFWL